MSESIEELIIPDYEEFMEKLYALHPVGKADLYYNVMKEKLGTVLYNKKPLTFELLVKKYSDYIGYLKPFNDIENKQYIKKDKIIKGIGEYITTGEYFNEYSNLVASPNDFYLFGI